jgi:putative peptidoglycan lipid II flippase
MAYTLPDEGTVSSLFIANRLVQLPLSIFAVATSVAILPTLSRLHTKKDYDELRNTLLQGLRQNFYFIMPAMAGLFILGQPVISLLFERGEFDAVETSRAATALAYYAGGLLAFAWVKVTVTGFYAMQDTKSPVVIATCAMLFNILLNFALIGPLGYRGLALSTTISYSLNALALYALLNHRIGGLWTRELIESLIRILLATAFMSAIAYGTWLLSARWFDDTLLPGKLMIALLPITTSIIAYAILSKAFGIQEFEYFIQGLKRRSDR